MESDKIVIDESKYIQQLSIDCVIFGFHGEQLKVLLPKVKQLELWSLPGGYVLKKEDIEAAAQRILEERTGLRDIYLEQFYVFGKANRSTGETLKKVLMANSIQIPEDSWVFERFISIGYYALVDFSKVNTKIGIYDEACEWHDIHQLPNLAFDHAEIIQKALETLRFMLDDKLVGLNLLPETFTMKELQILYETILDKPLRRDNFQRKILTMGILERIEKKFTGAAHKAPYLYKFVK
ncbi:MULTISPECIES: NrtR DNA-binding winged helix domain-containing protein [unclassified Arcicella]|uniref:NUDIX hydrolase n=1 Tax=unclassified Arcicella TaxID=2644986 RepID=UPI0028637A54|nr:MULTISPECIES: NUDIX domain-containing protein [unclassified Arcicella]MDR6564834.1 ADP-ribose pyrophosphatase YjhB (NUDIX family) [Arcicella sp. BE51]MDR6826049.1 ADP-ribose pyrophosphatase YjhB (NUDIX family) [Arcicella sp. BE139]